MLKTFSITDVGKERKLNQDYVFTSEIPVGKLANLFIVADGMGGMNAGEVASAIAIDSVKEAFSGNNLSKIISSPAKIKKFLQCYISQL